jgi:prolyl-tRNA synthetase
MLLAPTHEEEITQLVAQNINSYRQLPLRLYQIGPKFRNEARPKGGLLRCREFLMKDLYTFDCSQEASITTYNEVCEAYDKIFVRLGISSIKAKASSGAIGGSHSHEYHISCESGQDTVLHCQNCSFAGNSEVFSDSKCSNCGSIELKDIRALEIGHTFLLGEKYSRALDAKFKDQQGKQQLMQMGCFGIGVSRLMAAIVEANHDETGIIWPKAVAPFHAYVIPLASKHDSCSLPAEFQTCLLDDRENLSFSRKFKDAQLSGIPNIIFLGSSRSANGIEIYSRTEIKA